ncbi:MAG: ABC transporter ATP-binding protein [Desulfobacteraceae bacterium]|nr:MAG: ABC transporter ATP-binding protein [Desulfobacteraceae bacterium]
MALLEIRDLTKSFGGLMALWDVTFNVHEEEIVGLIGPNGSGKTTLFSTIMGSLRCDRGSIRFLGREITGLTPHQVCQRGIARTFQLTRPFSRMTVAENVIVGRLFGNEPSPGPLQSRREAEEMLVRVGLADKREAPASTLNLIQRKRLELARAMAARPRLLLLDEIMAGLNPAEIKTAVSLVREINDSGVTIIVVEHVMKALLSVSGRVIVLDAGRKIAEGPPSEIVDNPDVIKAYFGKNGHA